MRRGKDGTRSHVDISWYNMAYSILYSESKMRQLLVECREGRKGREMKKSKVKDQPALRYTTGQWLLI
jgi:hypothetical protein